jgi:hypothetical protein
MSLTRDYGNELGSALSGAYILLKQFEEIYKSLPDSEFYETKKKIFNILLYFNNKLFPDILEIRASFTDKVPRFEEQYHILESFGITSPIFDSNVLHELKSCHLLLESARLQAVEPIVESTIIQAVEPIVEKTIIQAVEPIVEKTIIQANKTKRNFSLIDLYSNKPTYNKKIKNYTPIVHYVQVKNDLGEYITEYNRIHTTIHHYLYSKKQNLFEFCSKCRVPHFEKNMVLKIKPGMSLSLSEIQEHYDNNYIKKGLIRYIKHLMVLREYENVVYIHINFKSFYGCMEIVIQKFRK